MKTFLKCSSAALSLLMISKPIQALPVYINEFHYDNQGADQGEFVEITGQRGSSLEGWQLEFYNGGNGKRYMTWDLYGSFSDQQAGFGVLAFTGSKGIQNGGSDGIALINNLGDVVQFVSYEGSLTAVQGKAEGMNSVDIGVFESPSTPIGSSLQLTGTTDASERFSWVLGSASPGEFNAGQYFNALSVPLTNHPSAKTPTNMDKGAIAVPEPAEIGLLGILMLILGSLRRSWFQSTLISDR